MQVKITSVFVDNQESALEFYTDVLGFIKKTDVPTGEYRWLTVVSPEDPEGVEILLEPDMMAREFKSTLRKKGIPYTQFYVDDINTEYARLKGLGVSFTMEPTDIGPAHIAIFDDTCGNLIQIIQLK